MRRPKRLISAAVLVALATSMGGCSSSGFEASDLLDWMDTKKKLPGDRKPVFPEGVPGVQQGVPRELYRGQPDPFAAPASQETPGAPSRGQVSVGAVQDVEPAAEPAPKKPRKQPAKRRAAKPVQQESAEPAEQSAPAPAPSSAFPAPLPSGSFSR